LKIFITSLKKKILPKRRLIEKWLSDVIKEEGKKIGDIQIILTSDNHILELNRKFLNHNYFTDVITFDYSDGNKISGDIFISVDTVEDNGIIYGDGTDRELLRVIVHGVLHLVGYNDASEEEKKKIHEKEDFYIEKGDQEINLTIDGFRK
jgi:probable rRNA maturation factor